MESQRIGRERNAAGCTADFRAQMNGNVVKVKVVQLLQHQWPSSCTLMTHVSMWETCMYLYLKDWVSLLGFAMKFFPEMWGGLDLSKQTWNITEMLAQHGPLISRASLRATCIKIQWLDHLQSAVFDLICYNRLATRPISKTPPNASTACCLLLRGCEEHDWCVLCGPQHPIIDP